MLHNLPEFLELNSDGEIHFKGHRIRIIDVASRFREGHSAEGIAFDIYPSLDLKLVYKGIVFYLEHESEIDALIAENRAEMDRQEALPRSTPTMEELHRRMNAKRPAEAS